MTDPDTWNYNRRNGKLERGDLNVCRFCDKEFGDESAAKKHLSQAHPREAVERFNQVMEGEEDLEDYNELKNHDGVEWVHYLKHGASKNIMEEESALTFAMDKAENVEQEDEDLIIRTRIYNNNDVEDAVVYANIINAEVDLVPFYPVGHEVLDQQIPNPQRILNVMEYVRKVNGYMKTNVKLDCPLFRAYSYERDMSEGIKPFYDHEEYRNWMRRGRVSDVGVNKVHVMPDGTVLPSRYIRQHEYRLGNLFTDEIQSIYESMAEFNENINFPAEPDPNSSKDLRKRHLAGDPNIFLNVGYPKPKNNSKEVN